MFNILYGNWIHTVLEKHNSRINGMDDMRFIRKLILVKDKYFKKR